MKAIKVTAFGGPENLSVVDMPDPSAGAGQVLIAVEAAGVGLADVLMRRGLDPSAHADYVPGLEVAGTVVGVGPDTDQRWVGSRVFTMAQHEGDSRGYAEYVVADTGSLAYLPPTVSSADAVATGINALVGHFAVQRAAAKPGERVLVRGASGGIGVMATQIAAMSGANVTVATSSEDRGRRLLELGASEVVNRDGDPFSGTASTDTFDVIVDPAGGPDIPKFLGKLAANGRMVACGAGGGFPAPDFAMEIMMSHFKSLTFSMLSLTGVEEPTLMLAAQEIFGMVATGQLKPIIDQTFPLEQAEQAHAKLESGEVFGKVILTTQREG